MTRSLFDRCISAHIANATQGKMRLKDFAEVHKALTWAVGILILFVLAIVYGGSV